MNILFVVSESDDWPCPPPAAVLPSPLPVGVAMRVLTARQYLDDRFDGRFDGCLGDGRDDRRDGRRDDRRDDCLDDRHDGCLDGRLADRLDNGRGGRLDVDQRTAVAAPGQHGDQPTRVVNLCHDLAYQSAGYYVSMLAEARGQQPLPDIMAIEDLRCEALTHLLAEALESQCQDSLAAMPGCDYQLELYFGRCCRPSDEASCGSLAQQLFTTFGLPLMRACFEKSAARWRLTSVQPLRCAAIAEIGLDQLQLRAQELACAWPVRRRQPLRPRPPLPAARQAAIAILRTPGGATMPSNQAAIGKFRRAADELGMRAEIISRDDLARIHEFDAVFIRDTTSVNDYTYRFARQASLSGLVVMDDPDSILRCSNKLFLHALLMRHGLPAPRTILLHRDNLQHAIAALGVPLILKQPDSAFSMGVVKVESPQQLREKAAVMFRQSDLLLAQEYLPTSFDWRIGILNRKPLFACRYHMAPGHWQVIKHEGDSRYTEGLAEPVAIDATPAPVIALALAAANLVGDGFYGVDLKQRDGHCKIVEINDNPNVDAGNEDGILHDALYRQVFDVIRTRVLAARGDRA